MTPRELLARTSSTDLAELMAYMLYQDDEQKRSEQQKQMSAFGWKGK